MFYGCSRGLTCATAIYANFLSAFWGCSSTPVAVRTLVVPHSFSQDLERLSAEKVGGTFRKLYVPPLGPLDDPAGVIYLDGSLTEKTVDSRVLDSVGEGIQEARKELYDLSTRRRTLVEERLAQKRRVRTENLHQEA